VVSLAYSRNHGARINWDSKLNDQFTFIDFISPDIVSGVEIYCSSTVALIIALR
jgi:hypothetical protein